MTDRGGAELAAARLESLQRVTAALATALTAEQITEELADHVTDSMDAQAWIVVIDEARRGLATAASGHDSDAGPAYQWIPIDAPSPLAEVARAGQPLWYPDAYAALTRWPGFREIAGDAASIAVVPLDAGDDCLGAIGLCFPQPRDLPSTDRNYLLTLGRVGGQALARARRYDSEHTIAVTLQRALLPELPELAAAEACARFHPASGGAQVGGDWYDVIALPQGRVGVAVGDVAGHNINAAAVMGQMRSTLRALAVSEEDPGTVMTGLNAMAYGFSSLVMTTVFYGVWDPAGTLDYVSAGHMPPLIRGPGGVRALYDTSPAVPIGADRDTIYTTATGELKPGETLLVYTDGLIERRTEPITTGIARLTQALESTPYDDLDVLCDDIRNRVHARDQEDDTALVALRPLPQEQKATPEKAFPARPWPSGSTISPA